MTTVVIGLFAMLLAWGGTRAFRDYALWHGVVDVPNERSSHTIPTPRGGGVAIVGATVIAMLVLAGAELLSWRQLTGVAGGGLLVAWIGFADDRRPVPPHWRLAGHFVAAAVLLWCLGPGSLPVTAGVLRLGLAGDVLALLFVVWMVNLTNFMDGIDGIASVEAISVALAGGTLAALSPARVELWGLSVAVAGACLGFLIWNWPPARIFMGDAGSGFLGFTLAAIALRAGQEDLTAFWGWVILLGVFVTDATWTLVRRIARGERFYQAHRSHGYQHAARRAGSHRRVTLAVLGLNLGWLFPIAALVTAGVLSPLAGVALAYAPLVVMAVQLRSGAADENTDGPKG